MVECESGLYLYQGWGGGGGFEEIKYCSSFENLKTTTHILYNESRNKMRKGTHGVRTIKLTNLKEKKFNQIVRT